MRQFNETLWQLSTAKTKERVMRLPYNIGIVGFICILMISLSCSNAPTETDSSWMPPQTPWGEPDLQGVWRHESTTPLQRPTNLEGRDSLTDDEVLSEQRIETEQVAKGVEGSDEVRPDVEASPFQRNEYNRFWTYTGNPKTVDARTSLIVDPPSGRIPLTPQALKVQAFHAEYVSNFPPEEHYDNSWRDRDTGERCITDGTLGQMWGGTGPNKFVQSPGYVVILHEQFRDRRIIPTDGREPSEVRTWLGNASGRWEENTLVVETTRFLDKTSESWQSVSKSASESMHLVERWTRIGPDQMQYQVTVTDPSKFTQPWSAELTLTNLETPDEPLVFFEYACAEGNYGIVNILSATRNLEKADPSLKNRRTNFALWLENNPGEPSLESLGPPALRSGTP